MPNIGNDYNAKQNDIDCLLYSLGIFFSSTIDPIFHVLKHAFQPDLIIFALTQYTANLCNMLFDYPRIRLY